MFGKTKRIKELEDEVRRLKGIIKHFENENDCVIGGITVNTHNLLGTPSFNIVVTIPSKESDQTTVGHMVVAALQYELKNAGIVRKEHYRLNIQESGKVD